MHFLQLIKNWVKKPLEIISNLLVPENVRLKKLLDLPESLMYELLPKSPIYSRDIFVLFNYENHIVRFIVKTLKYKNNIYLRKRVAQYLLDELLEISSEIALFQGEPPVLVPMPMSRKEKRERGFNQCEELVREIKKLGGDNIEVSYNTLKKTRETKRQTKLNREERLENVKNSMVATPQQSQGRVVIVLDDVYTTGASFAEARRALLSSGARSIFGLFIAH